MIALQCDWHHEPFSDSDIGRLPVSLTTRRHFCNRIWFGRKSDSVLQRQLSITYQHYISTLPPVGSAGSLYPSEAETVSLPNANLRPAARTSVH
jgi:hypothetical protein